MSVMDRAPRNSGANRQFTSSVCDGAKAQSISAAPIQLLPKQYLVAGCRRQLGLFRQLRNNSALSTVPSILLRRNKIPEQFP
jgi:hypothetical protein